MQARPVKFDGPTIALKLLLINSAKIVHNDINSVITALYKQLIQAAHIDNIVNAYLVLAERRVVTIKFTEALVYKKMMSNLKCNHNERPTNAYDILITASTHSNNCARVIKTISLCGHEQTIDFIIDHCSRCYNNGLSDGTRYIIQDIPYIAATEFMRIAIGNKNTTISH